MSKNTKPVPTANDQRSNVKNDNNPAFEKDRVNRENQIRETHEAPKAKQS